MKTKKPILRLAVLAALSFFTGNEVVAQTTVGAACGCPNYATRVSNGVININTVGTWTTIANAYGKELAGTQNILLTCDKIWQIDEKLYIGSGSTITIEPGTIIKGTTTSTVAAARALIIERGGKIIAPGTQDCPIIFTADADDLSGSYGVINKGKWGGVLLCGKATNNLTLAANGPFVPGQTGKLAVADGLGVLEGFASSIAQDQFGVQLSTPSNLAAGTSPSGTYSFDLVSGTNLGSSANVSGSFVISVATSSSLAAYYFVGMGISGTGIAPGATISAISTSSPYGSSTAKITLSLANVSTVSGNITFTGTYPTPNVNQSYYTVASMPSFANSTTGPFSTTGTPYLNYSAPYIGTPGTNTFDDNDNSGIMTYVSIRNSGANLLVGSEINGLTLASVGRGTKIEHIEIVSCADDNIEIFGGTVNLKYCTTMFGNDDMYDYDLGWTGKAQFLFGMKANEFTTLGGGSTTSGISNDSDNGFEMDSDDGKSYASRSTPQIYNATIIGNEKAVGNSDNSGLAGVMAKEYTGGEIRNSIFANFRAGFNMVQTMGSGRTFGQGGDSWHNWTNNPLTSATATAVTGNGSQSLKVKCNTFVGNTNALTLDASSSSVGTVILQTGNTASASITTASQDATWAQFVTTDKNIIIATSTGLAGFDPSFLMSSTTTSNTLTTKNDVVPNATSNVSLDPANGCPQAPMDGFFEPANYRGAFKPGTSNDNWLSDWSYSQVLGSTKGTAACPADINNDGVVNITDFGIFAPAYGNTCN
jgi:hypothetical protein